MVTTSFKTENHPWSLCLAFLPLHGEQKSLQVLTRGGFRVTVGFVLKRAAFTAFSYILAYSILAQSWLPTKTAAVSERELPFRVCTHASCRWRC